MTYSVFIDSDGVLADFDKKSVEILGGRQISEVPKGVFWARIEKYNRDVEPFFESLDLMPDARKLVTFCQDNFVRVAVLTASGYTPRDGAAQKHRWYAKHFPGLQVIVVDKSPDKAAYASSTSILIDDREKSIGPWVAAGGIGILHKDVSSTIGRLSSFIKK